MNHNTSKYVSVSSLTQNDVAAPSHADFTARFHEPIVFPVNAQVRLVNCRLNLGEDYITINHSNNRLEWSLGAGWSFTRSSGHPLCVAIIPDGTYKNAEGNDLTFITKAIENALNESAQFAVYRGGFTVSMDANKLITIKLSKTNIAVNAAGIGNFVTKDNLIVYERKKTNLNYLLAEDNFLITESAAAPSGGNTYYDGCKIEQVGNVNSGLYGVIVGNPIIGGVSADHAQNERDGSVYWEINCAELDKDKADWSINFGLIPEPFAETIAPKNYNSRKIYPKDSPLMRPDGDPHNVGRGMLNFVLRNDNGTVKLHATTQRISKTGRNQDDQKAREYRKAVATDTTEYAAGFANLGSFTLTDDISNNRHIGIRITFKGPGAQFTAANDQTYRYKVGIRIQAASNGLPDGGQAAKFNKDLYLWENLSYFMSQNKANKQKYGKYLKGSLSPYVITRKATNNDGAGNSPIYMAAAWRDPDHRFASAPANPEFEDLTIFGVPVPKNELKLLESNDVTVPAKNVSIRANAGRQLGFGSSKFLQVAKNASYGTGVVTEAVESTRADMASYFLEMPDLPIKNYTGGLTTGMPNNYVGIIQLHQKSSDDLYIGENRTQIYVDLHNSYPLQMNALRFRIVDINNNTVQDVLPSTIVNLHIRQHPDYARNKMMENIFRKLITEGRQEEADASAPQIQVNKITGQ